MNYRRNHLTSQDRVRQLRDKLMRKQLLPAFEMSKSRLDDFVDAIHHTRPAMLFGYPSSISMIARHAEKRGQSMRNLRIKVAFVTSERLYDHQRDDITRVFGCPVANGYGGCEAGFIAHQCPHGGMDLTAEDIVVEIIDNDGKVLPRGGAGEVVVTHLATGDFPVIRYRTGDVAVLSDKACPCGCGLPLQDEIQGRTTDFVMAADGTIMHGLAVFYSIRDIPGIASFKVVQETREKVLVQIVTGDGCPTTSNSGSRPVSRPGSDKASMSRLIVWPISRGRNLGSTATCRAGWWEGERGGQ
jgi:phenylacetate-CoA ligase